MTTVCKKCCAGDGDRCPKCTPVRSDCGFGKRKCRYKGKMAVVIKNNVK